MTDPGRGVLAQITEAVMARLAREPEPPGLEARAREAAGIRRREGRRSLADSLAKAGIRVIAECKRRSPSKGWLRQRLDPVALACAYEAGGAAAISVVTEPEFFAGQPGWVPAVRRAVALPVLQKDFLLAPRQLFEAAIVGADAVLLIARVLPGGLLAEMVSAAEELGLEALVEAYDARDLERVAATRARLVGINSRDLGTFEVDFGAAAALAARVPAGRTVVLESGVGGPDDVRRVARLGLRRLLVGEYLLRSPDAGAALAELVACA
ncbi:MAG TPA: indole-3-glycerol-phosphate synthase [Thermoanaerobaculaceae bacterium]|nr:indole-3-glycerol-phosphate synthase [Thermoanaerobaculaceae bacterium]